MGKEKKRELETISFKILSIVGSSSLFLSFLIDTRDSIIDSEGGIDLLENLKNSETTWILTVFSVLWLLIHAIGKAHDKWTEIRLNNIKVRKANEDLERDEVETDLKKKELTDEKL